MVQDINALYNGEMSRLVKKNDNFGCLNMDAMRLAELEGCAVVIRVRHGLPKFGYSTIQFLGYYKGLEKPDTRTLELPTSALELIADTMKR